SAANKYGQLIAIVDNDIYKRVGKYGSWSKVTTLSSPSNDEGEFFHSYTTIDWVKAEKEANKYSYFHLLGKITSSGGIVPSGQERWWTYWTKDFGNTWDSMQLYLPGGGIPIGTPSGLPVGLVDGDGITQAQMQAVAGISGAVEWNVKAHDIEGDVGGNVTVLLEGEPGYYGAPGPGPTQETFYVAADMTHSDGHTSIYAGTWYMKGYDGGNHAKENQIWMTNLRHWIGIHNRQYLYARPNCIFSVPNNREVAYVVAGDNWNSYLVLGRTSGNYQWWLLPPYDESDFPEWDMKRVWWEYPYDYDWIDAGPGSKHVFVDYSSLSGDSTMVRFVIVWAGIQTTGTPGGDDYPCNTRIQVRALFIEDDITKDFYTIFPPVPEGES
ncbi:unnamed protein product, partial [marine sediment metagenome]